MTSDYSSFLASYFKDSTELISDLEMDPSIDRYLEADWYAMDKPDLSSAFMPKGD